MHLRTISNMSQPNTDFIGQIPIAAIITLLASLRDLGKSSIAELYTYPA